jgi:hypothetical protein
MDLIHWLAPITPEAIFTLVCLGFITVLWIIWSIISSKKLAEKFHTMRWEELLWRKHGLSVDGLFFSMIVAIVILYGVWVFLGAL